MIIKGRLPNVPGADFIGVLYDNVVRVDSDKCDEFWLEIELPPTDIPKNAMCLWTEGDEYICVPGNYIAGMIQPGRGKTIESAIANCLQQSWQKVPTDAKSYSKVLNKILETTPIDVLAEKIGKSVAWIESRLEVS